MALINKVTTGFVTQVYDTEKKEFVSQEFTASTQTDYEDSEGNSVDSDLVDNYLPFDMVQPK